MQVAFILAALITLGNCGYYYLNEYRDYSTQISSFGRSIAISPSTVYSAMGYNVDFAIGTNVGDIYFGSLNDFNLKYSSRATQYPITNLTWTSVGLHIVSQYDIKIVDPRQTNWIKLSLNFSSSIKNAVFGYSNSSKSILTAISFYDGIAIFQNTTCIYNFTLYESCYAMSFSSSGDSFYYISRSSSNDISYMYRFDILTKTIYNTTVPSSYRQTSLNFFPVGVSNHLAVSTNFHSIVQWNNDSTYSTSTSQTYTRIKFTQDGENLVGPLYFNNYGIGFIDVNLNSTNFVSSFNSQVLSLSDSVLDVDTKRSYVIALASNQKVAIISSNIQPQPQPHSSNSWIFITIGLILGILLIIIIIGGIMKRRRMKQQQQNNVVLIQQNYVANPTAPSKQEHFFVDQNYNKLNQGLNNNDYFKNSQELNSNAVRNLEYRPPQ